MRLYKLLLLTGLSFGMLFAVNFDVKAAPAGTVHTPWFFGITGDAGTAISRAINVAIKYFLSDDTELVADLVWKNGKGCGGCYKGRCSGSGNAGLSAILVDLSIETDLFQGDALQKTCVADVAQKRLDASTRERASLADLDERTWELQYHSQRRAIQALTDALNAKRIYNEIKDVATTTMNDYSDYSNAVSSVASKRLLLDQLLALKKRIIAARLRIRAQTLDVNAPDLQRVTTAPDLTGICPDAEEEEEEDDDDDCSERQYWSASMNKCLECGSNFKARSARHKDATCLCNDGFEWNGTNCVVEENDDEGEE